MTSTPHSPNRPAVGCGIVPPDLLRRIAEGAGPGHPDVPDEAAAPRRSARWTRTPGSGSCARSSPSVAEATCVVRSRGLQNLRDQRSPEVKKPPAQAEPVVQRAVYDSQQTSKLPGKLVRGEGKAATSDDSVNRAYDGLGATWQLYWSAFQRDSLDAKGLELIASVHYQEQYDNAFWDGEQMVFGDGDGSSSTTSRRASTSSGTSWPTASRSTPPASPTRPVRRPQRVAVRRASARWSSSTPSGRRAARGRLADRRGAVHRARSTAWRCAR